MTHLLNKGVITEKDILTPNPPQTQLSKSVLVKLKEIIRFINFIKIDHTNKF